MRQALRTTLAVLAALVPLAGWAEPTSPPEDDDRFAFDLDWDRGIEYRYAHRVEDLDPTGLVAEDVVLEGRIGASLYLDGGFLAGAPLSDEGWRTAIRRARLYTRGRLERWLVTDYKFEFAIERGRLYLNDFYLRWQPGGFVDSLRVGYFDAPAAFQNLVASSSRVLMENSAPVAAFVPGFRLGIEASGLHSDPSLSWFLNLSSVGQDQEFGDASDQPLRLGGRLVWRPWITGPPDAADAELLHLGVSLGRGLDTSGSEVRHRARPESFLVDEVVDTGDIEGGNTLLGLEAVWRRGPVAVQGELLVSQLHDTDVGDPTFWGGYVQGNVALTGEVRSYDARNAVFRRMIPKTPFFLPQGGRGALEFAARLSWLDLTDADVHGGRLLTLSVGPAWTWNRNVRVLANVIGGHVSDQPDDGFLAIYQLRLELSF